jgi:membrane-associated phospholipid phosphatase
MGRVHGAALSHLGLTCVHYAHDSPLPLKLLALTSIWPLVALVYAFAKARHTPSLGSALGLLLTEIVARALKHLVRQPRPRATATLLGLAAAPSGASSSSHGWPSSHSALAAAFAALETLEVLQHAARGGTSSTGPVPTPLRAAELAAFWALAALTALSRVVLGYHSAAQAAAGFFLGVVVAAAWWRFAGDGSRLRRAMLIEGWWGGRLLARGLAEGDGGGERGKAASAPASASAGAGRGGGERGITQRAAAAAK